MTMDANHANLSHTKLIYLNFHPLEVVSRYPDPQLQVGETYYLFILRRSIFKYFSLNTHFVNKIDLITTIATHNFKWMKITHICLISYRTFTFFLRIWQKIGPPHPQLGCTPHGIKEMLESYYHNIIVVIKSFFTYIWDIRGASIKLGGELNVWMNLFFLCRVFAGVISWLPTRILIHMLISEQMTVVWSRCPSKATVIFFRNEIKLFICTLFCRGFFQTPCYLNGRPLYT